MKSLACVIWIFLTGLLTGALLSCNGYRCNDYSEYFRIADEGWRYADSLRFVPVHADSLCEGRFVVGITHTDAYPYTELCMEVSLFDGERHRHDTIAISVVDSYGSWTGSGIGASFQLTDTLAPLTHISGSPVTVRHIMRVDTLSGISNVGLFFVPVRD